MIIKKTLDFLRFNWSKNCYHSIGITKKVNKVDDINTNCENKISKNSMNLECNNALPYEKIPGPTTFSTVTRFLPGGKYYKMKRENVMKSMFNEYGDIVRLIGQFGKRDMILLRNPIYFEKVFRAEGIWPIRRRVDTVLHYRTVKNPEAFMNVGGLVAEQGEGWAKFRTKVNPILVQPLTVKRYIPKMDTIAVEFVDKIREIRYPDTEEVPGTFESIINFWALEGVCLVALDKKLGLLKGNSESFEIKQLRNALSKIFTLTVDLDFNPSLWKWIKTPKYYTLMKALDDLTQISRNYINEAIKRYENESISEKNENEKSVLEQLLKHDKTVAIVTAMDLILTGVDTTTTALTGCLLALAKNPEKQEKLRKEIRNILTTKNAPLTAENMKNLSYLRACMKEAFRIYPVARANMRAAGQDIVLCGYQIPKGIDIFMIPEYENTEFQCNKPNEFIPERWLREQNDVNQSTTVYPLANKFSHPFAYLPFGYGQRSCIARRFVQIELETAIVRIIRNFHIEFNYLADDIFTLNFVFIPHKELKFKFTDITE